jgi:hypothetical protein
MTTDPKILSGVVGFTTFKHMGKPNESHPMCLCLTRIESDGGSSFGDRAG